VKFEPKTEASYWYKSYSLKVPRLPLEGSLDLTYRCNNNCRHCWLRIPSTAKEKKNELSFEEIKRIVNEARAMGCKSWNISGGEPMLRPDFVEIFDFITAKAVSYCLNTNGTLITPKIARLLTRKGNKMVALYGATAAVHDHITRHPGSFAATMQGFAYLKEAGAGFIVQLVPMRDNYHQFAEMVRLAQSLSPHYRIAASWLHFSARLSRRRNAEIARQRLDPREVIQLDGQDLSIEDLDVGKSESACGARGADDRLYAQCIEVCRDFCIDPYGLMTFCYLIKDPALRYDLRRGSFREAWEEFIPSLADRIRGGPEYQENCGACNLRHDCRWCAVYGYLEHGRHSAKVGSLCQVAQETRAFKEAWRRHHRRYYSIAGITIRVEADLPITDQTFDPKFQQFQAEGPGRNLISLRHHFILPDLKGRDLGREVYRKPPWAIYRKGKSWIYLLISPETDNPNLYQVAVFNQDHSRGRIYHDNDRERLFRKGGLHSLTFFPSDQILLARVMADHQGCFFHSSGVIFNGQGLLFVGHSGAGKSTMVKMLQGKAEILSDDRNIVRRWPAGFRVHGTWSHGEVPIVSSASAPLRAILFLNKSNKNRLRLLENRMEILGRLLSCLIKPFITADWWEKILILSENISREVPCFEMDFDQSDKVVSLLEELVQVPIHEKALGR
jgi:MoaA/NifB/PqqE/SkfB family radical SAM enzyme